MQSVCPCAVQDCPFDARSVSFTAGVVLSTICFDIGCSQRPSSFLPPLVVEVLSQNSPRYESSKRGFIFSLPRWVGMLGFVVMGSDPCPQTVQQASEVPIPLFSANTVDLYSSLQRFWTQEEPLPCCKNLPKNHFVMIPSTLLFLETLKDATSSACLLYYLCGLI
ncbi:hypothetical protein J6590_032549 [Homalodisca vitripennis]|nr:hypothetical protein J6590_032549 [Homalodisca vitripennis]